MAETRKIVQLHKKDDIEEQWIPLTTGKCVQLTDYENNGETGLIEQTDTLNNALAKLENDKAKRGETLAEYYIGDAYTKEEVDALLSGIYRVQGGIESTDIHSTLLNADTKVGDVYDLLDDTVMTADFKEYEGQATPIAKGTNIVVVNDGTDENPVYKFDILALSVSQSITVATANQLGGIQVGYTTDSANRNYAVQLDGNNAYVNVPWTALPNMTGKTGKCLKVIESGGTLVASWETDNNTEYESKAEAQNGTDVSLVTTGDKYVWNRKQDALPDMTGNTGKCLKVVDNGGTPELSWETDTNTGVTSVSAGAGLNTTSDDETTDGGTPITGTGTLYLTKSGATAGSYGDASAQTPSFGDTFKVPYVTVDKYGRVTGITEHTVTLPTPSSFSLPVATSGALGGIKIGYSTNNRNYAVELSDEKAFVNVPWTDTHYTATPILGNSSSATTNATADTQNSSTFLNIIENSEKSGGVQIEGSGMVTVSAKNGKLTVSATDPIPSQSGNNNKFLMTNGSSLSWATPSDLNTFRAIQVDNTQLLATDANKAFDIIGGKNITLTTDNSQQGYASVTIDVTVGDVTNPTITSNVLAVEYGKNYFVGSSTATAAGVAAATGVTTLGFTVSGDSGFEANVFFKAGASGSGMTVNIPSGFLLIGEQPEYVSGNVYLISFYKGTAIMGEMTTYEYIRLTVRPNQPYTDRQVLIDSFNSGGASFGDEELSANDFIEDPNSEHTFYYKYPSNKHLTSIECLTYSGSISAVEITENLSELQNGFRGFQQTNIVSLPNATFNSSFFDGGQLFNLGDIVEIYVPTQPICELTYLNLYDADTLSVRSIENISYWLGNSGGDINFSETAWNRLSSEQKTTIRGRIEGKNWTIRFEDYTPNN